MSNYAPDGWALVKINGTDPHYRVFGSWRGGYLDGDAWRLNSGVVSVREDDEYYYFAGHSGSEYKCYKKSYGELGSYNASVYDNFISKSLGTAEAIYPEDFEKLNVMEIDWIIG